MNCLFFNKKNIMTQEFSGKDPKSVQKVTSIGAGPIGAGWSAYFLSQGYKVSVYLHEASEKDVLLKLINTAWISLLSYKLVITYY